jgi:hypothetical protein
MLVILFCAATVVSGVLLAVALWVLPMLGFWLGPWALPLAVLAGFLSVFLPMRAYVLPTYLASPAWRATTALTLWIGVTFALWRVAMSLVRPIMRSVGFERGTFVILLLCLLAGLFVIELALRPRRMTR